MSLASGDEIAAAPSTGTALGIMAFYVAADFLTTTEDFALRGEKEIIRDHRNRPRSWQLAIAKKLLSVERNPKATGL